jgi:hypothetical protein
MSFNLSGLTTYVDQTSQIDLITKALLKPQTVNNLTVKAGLTAGTTNLNILNANVDIKDAACGFGSGQVGSNTTIFTQLPIVVQAKMLKEQLCPDSLYDYWLSSQMSASAYHETVPFEEAIANLKVKEINKYVETTLWAGDGADLDGLLFQTSVAEGAVDGTAFGSTAWTASTAVANMWGLIDLLPVALKQEDDLVAYMSYNSYSKLTQGLIATGNSILLQYPNVNNVAGQAESSFIFPGTNIKVFAAPGIVDPSGDSAVILGPKKYLYMGTGIINDQDQFKFYYDPSQDVVNFMAKFKLGTAAYASQFVSTVA